MFAINTTGNDWVSRVLEGVRTMALQLRKQMVESALAKSVRKQPPPATPKAVEYVPAGWVDQGDGVAVPVITVTEDGESVYSDAAKALLSLQFDKFAAMPREQWEEAIAAALEAQKPKQ